MGSHGSRAAEQRTCPRKLPLRVEHRLGRWVIGQERAEAGVQEVGPSRLPEDKRPLAGFLPGIGALALKVEAWPADSTPAPAVGGPAARS